MSPTCPTFLSMSYWILYFKLWCYPPICPYMNTDTDRDTSVVLSTKYRPWICQRIVLLISWNRRGYRLVVCQMNTAVPWGNSVPMFVPCRILGGGIFRSALNCPKRCSQPTKYSFSGAALESLQCISLKSHDLWPSRQQHRAVKTVFAGGCIKCKIQ